MFKATLLFYLCLLLAKSEIAQNIFPSNGNVGINTTSPGYPLQIGTLYSGANGSINGASNPNRLIIRLCY